MGALFLLGSLTGRQQHKASQNQEGPGGHPSGLIWDGSGRPLTQTELLRDASEVRGLHQPLVTNTYPGRPFCHLFSWRRYTVPVSLFFDKK